MNLRLRSFRAKTPTVLKEAHYPARFFACFWRLNQEPLLLDDVLFRYFATLKPYRLLKSFSEISALFCC